jgi:phage tail-like protein
MAIERDIPYGNFNFLVQIGQTEAKSPQAGFLEVSGLAIDVQLEEYRNGNAAENCPNKVSGIERNTTVTLKRGLIGSLDLYQSIDQVRTGSVEQAYRTVVIQLLDEAHNGPVFTWTLKNAFPIRYVGPTLSAAGKDIAIEEIELAFDELSCE